jgi:hypothetical protein
MKQNVIKTTAIFRCIVTFKDGAHKIIRMTIDKVAHFVYLFRQQERNIFVDETCLFEMCENEWLCMSSVAGAKFINDRTDQEFLSISL